MKIVFKIIIVVCLLFAGSAGFAIEVFVSNSGSNSNTGLTPFGSNKSGPVFSIDKAIEIVRNWNKKNNSAGGDVVIVDDIYRISSTIKIGKEDSGTESSPLVIRGINEKVSIKGSVPIVFKNKINGSDKIWQVEVNKDVEVQELFIDGIRQQKARHPNYSDDYIGSWLFVEGKYSEKFNPVSNEISDRVIIDKEILDKLIVDDSLQINIFPRWNWLNDLISVSRIDYTKSTLVLSKNTTYPIRPGDRFFLQGSYSFLDYKNEWFFDKKNRILYYYSDREWPIVAAYPVVKNFFELNFVKNVHFKNLEISESVGSGITCIECVNVSVANCAFSNMGGESKDDNAAIYFSGGRSNRIVNNEINFVSGAGIIVADGRLSSLVYGDSLVLNNIISNVGLVYAASAAIVAGGSGNWIIGNSIRKVPRFGVLIGGANILVAYNKIIESNTKTEDSGAIYVNGRDGLVGRGSVIYKNIIYDSVGYYVNGSGRPIKSSAAGIYLDDNASDIHVSGNFVENTSGASLIIHNGSFNVIKNNIFRNGGGSLLLLRGFTKKPSFYDSMLETIKYYKNEPVWKSFFEKYNGDYDKKMFGNVISNNTFISHRLDTTYIREFDLVRGGNYIDDNLIDVPNVVGLVQSDYPLKKRYSFAEWNLMGYDYRSDRSKYKGCRGVIGDNLLGFPGCISVESSFFHNANMDYLLNFNWSLYRKEIFDVE